MQNFFEQLSSNRYFQRSALSSAAKTRSDDAATTNDSEISDNDDEFDDDDDSNYLSTAIIDVAASPVPATSQGAAETE